MQQGRLQPPVVGRGAVEAAASAEQLGERARPGARAAGPERQPPGQVVQLDLRRVDTGLVQRAVACGAHQQAQQREIGALGPRLLGEPPPHRVGALRSRWLREGMAGPCPSAPIGSVRRRPCPPGERRAAGPAPGAAAPGGTHPVVVVGVVEVKPSPRTGRGRRCCPLHLEPGRRGAFVQRAPGQRGHHGGGQPPPPVRRVHLDGRETGPAAVHDAPADARARRPAPPRPAPSRTTPTARCPAPQRHLGGPPAPVAAEPGGVRRTGQRTPHSWPPRRRRAGRARRSTARPSPRASSRAPPAPRTSAPACPRRPCRSGRTRAAPGRVPVAHPRQRLVQRHARVAQRQHRVGPPGEAGGRGTQLPVAEPTRSRPAARPARATRASSAYDAAGPRRRAGADGTTLPATSVDCAIRTRSPVRRVISSTPSSHDVRTPTVSVNFSTVSPSSVMRRTDTRLPTSAAVIRTSSRPEAEISTGRFTPPVRIMPRNGDTRGGHRRRRAPARQAAEPARGPPAPYRGGTTA